MTYENPPEVPGWVKAWFALEIPAFNALLKEADGTLLSLLRAWPWLARVMAHFSQKSSRSSSVVMQYEACFCGWFWQ